MTKARDIASAIPAPSTVSSAELGYLDGVTSAIQTQVDAKTAKATLTTTGDIYYASAANTPARLGIGSSAQVLTVAAGVPSWATPGGGNPAGTVIFYAANTAPTGFLKANGAAVSRSTYADLFAVTGTTFGVGDGSTTFNLPDLRGYFPRGWADNGSIDSGRTFGTTQEATSLIQRSGNAGSPVGNAVKNSDGTDGTATFDRADGTESVSMTYQKFRPVNIALLACIKF
jgi:hypothetical protein